MLLRLLPSGKVISADQDRRGCPAAGKQASHICTGTGLTPATCAPELGSPLPHLDRDWARPCHICARTGLTPAKSAPGLGSTLPYLHRDWPRPSHICIGTGPIRATSAPGLGSTLPHLHWDSTHPCHICAGTGPIRATLTLLHRYRGWAHPRFHTFTGTALSVVRLFAAGRSVRRDRMAWLAIEGSLGRAPILRRLAWLRTSVSPARRRLSARSPRHSVACCMFMRGSRQLLTH